MAVPPMRAMRLQFHVRRWLRGGLAAIAALAALPSAVAAAPPETAEADSQLVVAVQSGVPPLGFRGEDGQLRGLQVDLARRLAQRLRGSPQALELLPVANRQRLQAVLSGQADLAIAHVTVTAARSRLVSFSRPYYLDGTALVAAEPDVRERADLAGRKIALLQGSSAIAAVRHALPQAQLVAVDSYRAGLEALEADKAAAFAGDRSILSGWVDRHPAYRQLPGRLSTEPLGIVLPKGAQHAGLRQQVNAAIADWRRSGWLQQTVRQWGLPQSQPDRG